jgi:hypothetical protein
MTLNPFNEPNDGPPALRLAEYDYCDVQRLPRDKHRVPMYFEHPLDVQPTVRPVSHEEEGVARSINWGRTLMLTSDTQPPEITPTVDPDFSLDNASKGSLEEPFDYSVTIAGILQAAVHSGWDPVGICRNALII